MGNSPSVEAPRKGSRAPQKLSKPRIGNPGTAGLLNPNGNSDVISRSTSTRGRRLSQPHGSTPAPSSRHPGTETTAVGDLIASNRDSAPGDFLSTSFPKPDLPRGSLQHRSQRSQSVGLVAGSNHGRLISRSNSIYMGVDEGNEQAQPSLTPYVTSTEGDRVNSD
jgi:hypothetical protein